eukprot:2048723-Amphidinium_carterae.1
MATQSEAHSSMEQLELDYSPDDGPGEPVPNLVDDGPAYGPGEPVSQATADRDQTEPGIDCSPDTEPGTLPAPALSPPGPGQPVPDLSLIHISEPTRPRLI